MKVKNIQKHKIVDTCAKLCYYKHTAVEMAYESNVKHKNLDSYRAYKCYSILDFHSVAHCLLILFSDLDFKLF